MQGSANKRQPIGPVWRTLRFRLAVWNAAAVIITALVTLVGLRQGVSWALLRELDQVLLDDAQDIGLMIEATPADQATALQGNLNRMAASHEHHGWYVKLFDADADEIWATTNARPAVTAPRPRRTTE